MATPDTQAAQKQAFLYQDRPIDDKGNKDLYWHPDQQQTAAQKQKAPANTAVLVVQRRVCRCSKCSPYPALVAAKPPSASSNAAWTKAPTAIELERATLIGGLTDKSYQHIMFPVEFTQVKTTKVITLWCKQTDLRWDIFHSKALFDEFISCYRFRSDNPNINLAFFWADKKAQVKQARDAINIKLALSFPADFVPKAGDTARIILEKRIDDAGNYMDVACLPQAIKFCNLAELPTLNRFFGKPDWEVGDVALFIDKTEKLAVFRLTKTRRDQIREFLDKREPLGFGVDISRETALVLVLTLLWYLDKEWGDELDQFFANPVKYIKEKYQDWVDGKAKRAIGDLLKPMENRIKRTAYGAALSTMDPETRKAWISLRHEGKELFGRCTAIMDIVEKIEQGLLWVAEGFRIHYFIESVLRPDTLYSSNDQYFFVSFCLDNVTFVPNGVVCSNYIPLGFEGKWEMAIGAISNQFIFWESGDAYYLRLLDINRHVRNYRAAKAKEETEGKEVCYYCKSASKFQLFGDGTCDSTCSVCGQKFHRVCMPMQFGDADCPRCLQNDVVVKK